MPHGVEGLRNDPASGGCGLLDTLHNGDERVLDLMRTGFLFLFLHRLTSRLGCEGRAPLFTDQLDNLLETCGDFVVILRNVRKLAIGAVLDAGVCVAEAAAALASERIERAVSEQTVEARGIRALVTGEVFAGGVLKKGIVAFVHLVSSRSCSTSFTSGVTMPVW